MASQNQLGLGANLRRAHFGLLACLLGGVWSALDCTAQLRVTGVQDKSVIADRVSFVVPSDAGYEYACRLDGVEFPAGMLVDVTQPGYHELWLERTPAPAGAVENKLVRFIVRSSARGNSEWGLPPWTPYPVVNSSAAEVAGARLRVVTPRSILAGMDIPVIAMIEDEQGMPVRANGLLVADGLPSIQLRRGFGSGLVAAPDSSDAFTWSAQLHGLRVTRTISVETNAQPVSVAGALAESVTWSEDSRVLITGDLEIPSHATLTVEQGTVIALVQGANIIVSGELVVRGSRDAPVVFAPASRSAVWGGFVCRGATARIEATGAIFTGSGANPNWFGENPGYDVHLREQALLLLDSARATLTDCYLMDGKGQAGHGKNAQLMLTRCLVQRFLTSGEYNGGSVQIFQSALIEFPRDDGFFADDDNDGIYFTTGNHLLQDTLIGWAKDDGVDAGSGGAGSVTVSNCWLESCYHEAFAWSGGGRIVTNLHCVAINCGQGIEAGWSSTEGSPDVYADNCLSAGNLIGARFGDNYDWSYNGFLRVTNSLLLFNHRDIWGMNWDDWTYRVTQMDLQGNLLSAANTNHPNNLVWQPGTDGWRLASFLSTPPAGPVGVAFASRARQAELASLTTGVAVGLSCFTTNIVSVDYAVEGANRGVVNTGTLTFAPGETVKAFRVRKEDLEGCELVRARLSNPAHAEFTGDTNLYFMELATEIALVPAGSVWRYKDDGSDQGVAWRESDFDDTGWRSGPAELGFGDDDEATPINIGPEGARFATTYFRHKFIVQDPSVFSQLLVKLRRDDGAIVYLNTNDVFRSNMPEGDTGFKTYTGKVTSSETEYFTTNVAATALAPGVNTIAVEVHQANKDSGDLSFDLELTGVIPPRVNLARMENELALFWAEPSWMLEEADSVGGPWRTLSTVSSPISVTPSASKFYRLRKP